MDTFNTSLVSNGYLISICKEGGQLVITLLSGETVDAKYVNSDKFTILVKRNDTKRNQLIYKHAIESIEKSNV